MKKYIQPQIDVNEVEFLLLDLGKSEGEGYKDEEFSNSTFFDDEQASIPSSKSLWDD